ncbi:MAG: M16 family metallopeptidase [Fusobacteriaceae bacterium]
MIFMIDIRTLKNGIPVLMEKVEDIKSFTMGIFVKTGARNELKGEFGLSHYIEHMMFKGTKTRTAKELSEIIDDNGGSMNAYTSKDTTCYYVKMLSTKLDITLDIFSDMFLNSTFTEENLEKERNVILEEIKMYEDIPEEIVHDENIKFVLKGEYANGTLGDVATLKKIDRDIFLNYFNQKYVPSNMGISIAGNFDFEELYKKLNENFGQIEDKPCREEKKSEFKIHSGINKIKKDCNQVHLCFNTLGVPTNHKDKYIMSLLSNVLGENMSSRLFQKIREDKGLAYSVYSYSTNFKEGGLFTVYAGTSKESYELIITLIKEEFELIKKEGITQREIERAKNQIISMLTFALENSRGKMARLWNSYLLYGKIITVEEIDEIISKITLEDIKRVANAIFKEEYYSVTILGEV